MDFLQWFTIILLALTSSCHCQNSDSQRQYFLKQAGLQFKSFSLPAARNGQLFVSEFEKYRELYANVRTFFMQEFEQKKAKILAEQQQMGKLQPHIPSTQSFPCNITNGRSKEPPLSVHALRPGDIDIIGAMGDSLTAGTAILAEQGFQVIAEFRGVTAMGGGLEDWRTYLTLPNILKVYNPQLYGYAMANSLARERPSRFVVAEGFALTADMPYQALVLVRRLQTDPRVEMRKHWKLISLFIGANDVCGDLCYYDNWQRFLDDHRQNLYRTLKILKDNVPRLLVNLMAVPNLRSILEPMRNIPLPCFAGHRVACSCLISRRWDLKHIKRVEGINHRMQQIEEELASLPEFQTNDFSVVFNKVVANATVERRADGSANLSFFASDCFHLSQLGQATLANGVWNNLLQNVTDDYKQFSRPFRKFACPSEELPYLATLKNQPKDAK